MSKSESQHARGEIMESPVAFDIETAPESEITILEWVDPFPDFVPGEEFDPKSVKLGAMKDEEKIKAKIESAKIKHAEDEEARLQKWHEDKVAAEDKVFDKACLYPQTGRVLCIGYQDGSGDRVVDWAIDPKDEADVLRKFWERISLMHEGKFPALVGFNVDSFDVPFIVMRSLRHGIKVDRSIFVRGGKFLNERFVRDLRIPFTTIGGYGGQTKWSGLNDVCRFLNIPGKFDGEVEGANFWKFATSEDEEDFNLAEEYLFADLEATSKLLQLVEG